MIEHSFQKKCKHEKIFRSKLRLWGWEIIENWYWFENSFFFFLGRSLTLWCTVPRKKPESFVLFLVVLWPVAALGKAKGTTRLFLLLISAAVFNAITHVSSLLILYMLDPKCLQQPSGPSALYICYDTSRWFLMCRKKMFSFSFFEVTLAKQNDLVILADFVFVFKWIIISGSPNMFWWCFEKLNPHHHQNMFGHE